MHGWHDRFARTLEQSKGRCACKTAMHSCAVRCPGSSSVRTVGDIRTARLTENSQNCHDASAVWSVVVDTSSLRSVDWVLQIYHTHSIMAA